MFEFYFIFWFLSSYQYALIHLLQLKYWVCFNELRDKGKALKAGSFHCKFVQFWSLREVDVDA